MFYASFNIGVNRVVRSTVRYQILSYATFSLSRFICAYFVTTLLERL